MPQTRLTRLIREWPARQTTSNKAPQCVGFSCARSTGSARVSRSARRGRRPHLSADLACQTAGRCATERDVRAGSMAVTGDLRFLAGSPRPPVPSKDPVSRTTRHRPPAPAGARTGRRRRLRAQHRQAPAGTGTTQRPVMRGHDRRHPRSQALQVVDPDGDHHHIGPPVAVDHARRQVPGSSGGGAAAHHRPPRHLTASPRGDGNGNGEHARQGILVTCGLYPGSGGIAENASPTRGLPPAATPAGPADPGLMPGRRSNPAAGAAGLGLGELVAAGVQANVLIDAEAVAGEEPGGRRSRCRRRLPCGLAGSRQAGAGS
jgi:hypothetical protein